MASIVMRGALLIETEGAAGPFDYPVSPATLGPRARLVDAYVDGILGWLGRDRSRTEGAARAIGSLVDSVAGSSGDHDRSVEGIMARQLEALSRDVAGQRDAAVEAMIKVAADEGALPGDFGPPAILKPSAELLGDLLVLAGRGPEAVRWYRAQLRITPGRSLSLKGLVAAARLAGDDQAAAAASDALAKNWARADPMVRAALAARR
jgi:hypothetical protein